MEPPRAPAPRPRPSPAPSPSHNNLVNASPQLVSLLRQSPSHYINSAHIPRNQPNEEGTLIKNHNEIVNLSSPCQSTSIDIAQNKSVVVADRLTLTPQSNKITGDITFTPTYSTYAPSQNTSSVPNPHSTIVPQTPNASGHSLAKNSIKLQNCVATVNLQCELKLLDIYCKTRFSEYNPSRFHGVVMRILEPRATALVFRSGKVVCTGAKNEHDSLLATRKFSRIIKKLGFPVTFSEFKIQNLVATADLRFPIKLEALQQAHGQFTSYEPELFPGLIYRMIRPRIVLLIFVNGKIVFTGAKSREDIEESLNIIYPILRSFKKN